MSRIILTKKEVFKIRTASNTIVLHPTFELATFGEIEWRASDDFADAEKCHGIKLPQISLYLLMLKGTHLH